MQSFTAQNIVYFLWPLFLMFTIGIGSVGLFLTVQRFRSFKGLVYIALPGFTFLFFSLISFAVSYNELNDIEAKFKRDSIHEIQIANSAALRSIKQGAYVELGPQLADLASKAHFTYATVSLLPGNTLVAAFGNPRSQATIETQVLVSRDIDGTSVKWGHLKWQWDVRFLNLYLDGLKSQWMTFSAIIFGMTFLLTLMLSSYLFQYLRNSSDLIRKLSIAMKDSPNTEELVKKANVILGGDNGLYEEVTLKNNIRILMSNMSEMSELVAEKQTHAALGELAAQVAHDVRSPLSAIKVVAHGGYGLNSEAQELLKAGCLRVEEILTDLRSQAHVDTSVVNKNQFISDEIVLDKVEKAISEKRFLFPNIKFEIENRVEISQTAKLSNVEFSRILSNLINNAAEAMNNTGTIQVSLKDSDPFLDLTISDYGPGISEDRLLKLGARGVTIGKKQGTGLGIWHAKSSVELWGGAFSIRSKVGMGTQVQVSLLKSANG